MDPVIDITNNNDDSMVDENVKHVALEFKELKTSEEVDETDLVGSLCHAEESVVFKTSSQTVCGETGQDHSKVPGPRPDNEMSDSSLVDQHKKEHCSDSSASKIPVSTMKRGKKYNKRKSIKLPSVDSNKSNDRLFDEMADESEALSPMNFSDGAIDDIIRQSCKKSNEKILDSTADDLDGSDDVLLDDDKRLSVCDSIVTKFLEVTTTEKMKINEMPTYLDVKSPNCAVSPVMNMKADYLQINNDLKTSTHAGPVETLSANTMPKQDLLTVKAAIKKESVSTVSPNRLLCSNDDIKTSTPAGPLHEMPTNELPKIDFLNVDDTKKESMSPISSNCRGSNEVPQPSTLITSLEGFSDKSPEKDLLKVVDRNKKVFASPVSSNRLLGSYSPLHSTNVEYMIKGFGDKSALFENKIDSLESRLTAALERSQEKNEECDDFKRKLTLAERELDISDEKCKHLEIKVGNLKEDFEGKGEELRMLKAQYNQLEKEIVIENGKVEKFVASSKDSTYQLEQQIYTIKSLESKILSYEAENCRMEDDIKAKKDLNERTMLELDECKRKYKFLELEITKLEESSSSLSLKLNETTIIKEEKEDALKCLKNAAFKVNEECSKKEQQVKGEEERKVEKKNFKQKLALFNSPKVPEPVKKVVVTKARQILATKKDETDAEIHEHNVEDVPVEENEKLTNSYRSLTEERGRLEERNSKLIVDLKEKESKLTEKEQDIVGFRNKYEIVLDKLGCVEDKLKESNEKLSEITRDLEEKERCIKNMESLSFRADEKNKAHDENNIELQNKYNITEAELENKERNIIQLETKLDSRDKSLEEVQWKLAKVEQELKNVMETSKSLQFCRQQNEDEIDQLSKKEKEDNIKMNGLEVKLEEVEKSLKFLEHENGRLSEELDKMRTQQHDFVEQINLDVSTMLL